MFESVKELGLTGWPAVAAISIICFSIVAFFHGEWPWKGMVNIHKHYHNSRKKKGEEEDEG